MANHARDALRAPALFPDTAIPPPTPMKRHATVAAISAVAAVALSGCVSTQDVSRSLATRYVGQPSDAFFAQYGPPTNSMRLNDGSTVYNWHGGDSMIMVPAEYKTVDTPASPPLAGNSTTRTSVSHPDENTTVTNSSTTSWSLGGSAGGSQQVLVRPAYQKQLYCEARITADPQGRIVSVEATQDTQGAGFSISRCAEVFNVK